VLKKIMTVLEVL